MNQATAASLLVLLPSLGCGGAPKHVDVHGSVAYAGAAIVDGHIQFVPIEGTEGFVAGGHIQDGEYQLTGPEAPLFRGIYQVQIRNLESSGRTIPAQDPAGRPIPVQENTIPDIYNTNSTRRIEFDSEAPRRLDFDLPEVKVTKEKKGD